MTSSPGPVAPAAPAKRPSVALALEQNNELKAKVKACADEVSAANAAVQQTIAHGAATLSAPKALAQGRQVEHQIKQVAVDLQQVAQTLAQGIEELEQLEAARSRTSIALVESSAALAATRKAAKEARQRALHDSRTGLPNRDLFNARLQQAMFMAKRHGWTLALMFVDLDGFKCINDRQGHAAGDKVLRAIAARLSQHARKEDIVCRNGGDEFLYLLVNPQGTDNIERIARNILHRIAQPLPVGDLQFVVQASIGIALYPDSAMSAEALIGLADSAMYRAKRDGTGYAFDGAVERAGTIDT